jgi:hypothetical protein
LFFKSNARTLADGFWSLHSKLSARNSRFKGIHLGETCYIFANGGSLKYYDIDLLPRKLTFCCSFSLIDKRMQNRRPEYNFFTDSYLFYPILFNTYPFVRKFQKNEFSEILQGIIQNNPKTHNFCNITNYYAVRKFENLSYFHHYGARTGQSYDLAYHFSTCGSALEVMVGAARFMGVQNIYLFGCDYLYDRPQLGHFYADYVPFIGEPMPEYLQKMKTTLEGINVKVVRPKGYSCENFDSVTYEDHFGLEPIYRHNHEMIEESILYQMRIAHKKFQLQMEPF